MDQATGKTALQAAMGRHMFRDKCVELLRRHLGMKEEGAGGEGKSSSSSTGAPDDSTPAPVEAKLFTVFRQGKGAKKCKFATLRGKETATKTSNKDNKTEKSVQQLISH